MCQPESPKLVAKDSKEHQKNPCFLVAIRQAKKINRMVEKFEVDCVENVKPPKAPEKEVKSEVVLDQSKKYNTYQSQKESPKLYNQQN